MFPVRCRLANKGVLGEPLPDGVIMYANADGNVRYTTTGAPTGGFTAYNPQASTQQQAQYIASQGLPTTYTRPKPEVCAPYKPPATQPPAYQPPYIPPQTPYDPRGDAEARARAAEERARAAEAASTRATQAAQAQAAQAQAAQAQAAQAQAAQAQAAQAQAAQAQAAQAQAAQAQAAQAQAAKKSSATTATVAGIGASAILAAMLFK